MVEASDSIPVWAFVLVIIIILVLMAALTFWLVRRRRLSRSPTVDIENTGETKLTTVEPIESKSHTVTATAAPPIVRKNDAESKVTEEASSHDELLPDQQPQHEAKQDWKIALPLPPPSTSLFSDKMELSSDEAMELFDRYMNAGMENRGDHDRLSFAANVQQKAATIRSTMRRSLRRKKSTKTAPLDQLFDQGSIPPRSPSVRRKSSAQVSACSSPSVTSRVDQPPASFAEEMPESKSQEPVNAMDAAQQVIRSASRKSKTRSMLVNEEDVHRIFSQQEKEAANERNAMTITSGSVRRLVRDSLVNEGLDKTRKTPASALEISQWFPDDRQQQQRQQYETKTTIPPPPRKPAKLTEKEQIPTETFFESHGITAENMATSEKCQMGPRGGEVDTIRRMLQATWKANMKESGSMASIASTAGPAPSSANPRQQNQFLLAQSLKSSSSRGIRKSSEEVVLVQPPAPTTSFSSSTVRTVVPEPKEQQQKKQQQQQSLATSVTSIVAQEKIEVDGTNFAMAPSGHQTWNGRSVKKAVQQLEQNEKVDRSSFFKTVHVGRRQSKRRVVPWMDSNNTDYKATPAQQERDQYLRSLYGNVNNA